MLVDYHDRQGDLGEAIAVCRRLAELQPQDPAHRTRLADLYERKGDHAGVAREYLEIARVMLARGALEKATQVLERALAVNGGDAAFLLEAVRLLQTEGHHAFAETFLSEAEEMNVRAGRPQLVEDVRARLVPVEEPPAVPPDAPPLAAAPSIPAPPGLSLDLEEDVYLLQPVEDDADEDTVQRARAAASQRPAESTEDVLGEIEVFVKYGFREKALDRIGELLRSEPLNLRAHRLLVDLLLADGSHRAALEAANHMAAAAAAGGDQELWRETRDRLRAEGFLIAGDAVEAAPAALDGDGEEFELLETGGPEREPSKPEARETAATPRELFAVLPTEVELEPEPPRSAVPSSTAPTLAADAPPDSVDFVVVDDGEFADLAAEVELEMETTGAPPPVEAEAPTVEEIVASFKQGVAENLSPEDYDTHYNLGIAYREMGLVDEAIGEFEIAVQSRDYLIGCCSLLGLCFRDKGEIETAMQWYTRGLGTPDILEQEKHALLYDLGEAYETAGDLDSARKAFSEISVVDGGYRDVGDRLAALS